MHNVPQAQKHVEQLFCIYTEKNLSNPERGSSVQSEFGLIRKQYESIQCANKKK